MRLEEVQRIAFQLIAHSGDAFDCYYRAIGTAQDGDYQKAHELMKEGDEKLNDAHTSQARLLQVESQQEEIPFSIIMTHAQDHLTMAISWQRLASLIVRGMEKNGKL